jgi:hypothetical protein
LFVGSPSATPDLKATQAAATLRTPAPVAVFKSSAALAADYVPRNALNYISLLQHEP